MTATLSPPEKVAVDVERAGPRLRRTLRLEQAIDDARIAGAQVLLAGGGVHDLFIDPERRALWLPDLLRSYCARRGLGLVVYRLGSGAISMPTLPNGESLRLRAGQQAEVPTQAIERVLSDVRDGAVPAVVLFDYTDSILPADSGALPLDLSLLVEHIQALTADIPGWQTPGLQLVLVDRGGGINERIAGQPGIHHVDVDPPDLDELTTFLELAENAQSTHPLYLEPGLDAVTAARRASGLLLRDVHELRAASTAEVPLTARTLSGIKGESLRTRSHNTLDLLDEGVSFGTDVAGMHNVRLHIARVLRRGRLTVRICLTGPPGTGKTYSAQAIARSLEVPLVSLGQILGELLGQAENNMRAAIALLKAMAPVALFIDEAEQGSLGARGRGGQSVNEAYGALRQQLLTFLGDPGRDDGISVIATTNVPTALDNAAESRFEFLPVLFASGPELAQIMVIQARREAIPVDGDFTEVLSAHLDRGVTLSGRSAHTVLTDAWDVALESGVDVVTAGHIETALTKRIATDWTPDSEFSTLVSLMQPSIVDALPWEAARIIGEPYPMPAYLLPFLTPTMALDTAIIRTRIAELDRAGVYR